MSKCPFSIPPTFANVRVGSLLVAMRNQNHLIDLIQFIHLSDAYDLLIQLIYIICLESFSPEAPVSPDLPDPDLFDSTDPHYACCSPFFT